MTAHITYATTDLYVRLWRGAVNDTAMSVSFLRPGSSGRLLGDTIADLLVGAGRAQPCLVESPREVTRADLGRLQVGLARCARDLVVLHAERLPASDAELLNLCATRAGVDLFLIAEGRPEAHSHDFSTLTTFDPEELLEAWSHRHSTGRRAERWDCHAALGIGQGLDATCARHSDAIQCVLEWFPHAFATARVSAPAVRARLYELGRTSIEAAMRVWPHARDMHYGARMVADVIDLPAQVVRNVAVLDLAADASAITWGGRSYQVPVETREILHVARADKLADGFGRGVNLFQVRTSSVKRFRAA